MVRIARAVAVGVPHHVTQRGNNHQDVFIEEEDCTRYLSFLKEQAKKYALAVHAFCLMSNHVHLISVPLKMDSLAKAIGRTHFLYAQYFNRKQDRNGHVWQNRFYSCPLDATHYWAAIRYLERNPVRAGLVREAWLYPWSSARTHITGVDPVGLIDLYHWRDANIRKDWRATLKSSEDESVLSQIRCSTQTGRPLGDDSFISKLENELNRQLLAPPRGRPRKQA